MQSFPLLELFELILEISQVYICVVELLPNLLHLDRLYLHRVLDLFQELIASFDIFFKLFYCLLCFNHLEMVVILSFEDQLMEAAFFRNCKVG